MAFAHEEVPQHEQVGRPVQRVVTAAIRGPAAGRAGVRSHGRDGCRSRIETRGDPRRFLAGEAGDGVGPPRRTQRDHLRRPAGETRDSQRGGQQSPLGRREPPVGPMGCLGADLQGKQATNRRRSHGCHATARQAVDAQAPGSVRVPTTAHLCQRGNVCRHRRWRRLRLQRQQHAQRGPVRHRPGQRGARPAVAAAHPPRTLGIRRPGPRCPFRNVERRGGIHGQAHLCRRALPPQRRRSVRLHTGVVDLHPPQPTRPPEVAGLHRQPHGHGCRRVVLHVHHADRARTGGRGEADVNQLRDVTLAGAQHGLQTGRRRCSGTGGSLARRGPDPRDGAARAGEHLPGKRPAIATGDDPPRRVDRHRPASAHGAQHRPPLRERVCAPVHAPYRNGSGSGRRLRPSRLP